MKVRIDGIRIDGGTQTREVINEATVTEYTENLLDGADFPPIEVFDDGVHKWLVDGFHRLFAHKRAGEESIEVKVHQGTLRDAQLYALGVNDTHGLQRSNADKRKSVLIVLDDLEWQDWSDQKIANICRVSHTFVAKMRKTTDAPQVTEKKYINKHGTESKIQTKNIGKKQEGEVATQNPAIEITPVVDVTPVGKFASEDEDQIMELSQLNGELHEENLKLQDKMVALSDDQEEINQKFEDLRGQVKGLEAELKAVKNSRDQFQAKNAELIKQVNYWRKRAEKAAA